MLVYLNVTHLNINDGRHVDPQPPVPPVPPVVEEYVGEIGVMFSRDLTNDIGWV